MIMIIIIMIITISLLLLRLVMMKMMIIMIMIIMTTIVRFAVPFGVMRKAVTGAAVDQAVKALAEALKGSPPAKIEECAAAARKAVEACAVPAKVVEDLIAKLPKGTDRVAVRSSANSEDRIARTPRSRCLLSFFVVLFLVYF